MVSTVPRKKETKKKKKETALVIKPFCQMRVRLAGGVGALKTK